MTTPPKQLKMRTCSIATLIALMAAGTLGSNSVLAQSADNIEEISVLGRQEFLARQFTAERSGANVDAAKLINQVPGGSVNNNGPLTGQIQYRGMSGRRINVTVDGMLIHGGGPNWMAPPLHHIPAGLMKELVVEQGIASVTHGGGIGGAATAYMKKPDYGTDNKLTFSGDTEFGFGTVDSGNTGALVLGLSSNKHRLFALGSHDKGDDFESNQGTVGATQYERGSYGAGYGYRSGNHQFEVDYRSIETDDTGTPSLPLDIDWFYTDLWNAAYSTSVNGVDLSLRIYGTDIDHGMNNFTLRTTPDFSSLNLPPFFGDDKRNVETSSQELGFKFALQWQGDIGDFAFGIEGKDSEHEATVFDPDFAPFFVRNFNDTQVESLAVYGQWSRMINSKVYVEAGIRSETVEMDTGDVDAFPARLVDNNPTMFPFGTPPRAVFALRENFNAAERSQTDHNLDWVLKSRFQATDNLIVELGVAQKVRSPLYQERYLWLPLEANGGIGDGNNYIGNPNLNPEEALEYEIGFDWTVGDFYFSPRFFYRKVDDYIQGIPVTNPIAIAVSANATGDPTPLVFGNTDADFRGVDLSFGAQLGGNWSIDGIASMVNAQRRDINDNLYRITPDNLRVGLTYTGNNFSARIEEVLVREQDDISLTNTLDPGNGKNNANPTDGYALTNVHLSWQANNGLTITTGVENLFDEDYVDHVTGFNQAIAGVVPVGSRLFGQGRNLFARMQINW